MVILVDHNVRDSPTALDLPMFSHLVKHNLVYYWRNFFTADAIETLPYSVFSTLDLSNFAWDFTTWYDGTVFLLNAMSRLYGVSTTACSAAWRAPVRDSGGGNLVAHSSGSSNGATHPYFGKAIGHSRGINETAKVERSSTPSDHNREFSSPRPAKLSRVGYWSNKLVSSPSPSEVQQDNVRSSANRGIHSGFDLSGRGPRYARP